MCPYDDLTLQVTKGTIWHVLGFNHMLHTHTPSNWPPSQILLLKSNLEKCVCVWGDEIKYGENYGPYCHRRWWLDDGLTSTSPSRHLTFVIFSAKYDWLSQESWLNINNIMAEHIKWIHHNTIVSPAEVIIIGHLETTHSDRCYIIAAAEWFISCGCRVN